MFGKQIMLLHYNYMEHLPTLNKNDKGKYAMYHGKPPSWIDVDNKNAKTTEKECILFITKDVARQLIKKLQEMQEAHKQASIETKKHAYSNLKNGLSSGDKLLNDMLSIEGELSVKDIDSRLKSVRKELDETQSEFHKEMSASEKLMKKAELQTKSQLNLGEKIVGNLSHIVGKADKIVIDGELRANLFNIAKGYQEMVNIKAIYPDPHRLEVMGAKKKEVSYKDICIIPSNKGEYSYKSKVFPKKH